MHKGRVSRQLAIFLVIAIALSLLGAVIMMIATGGCSVTRSIPAPAMTKEPASVTTSGTSQSQGTDTKPGGESHSGKTSGATGETLPPLIIVKKTFTTRPATTTTRTEAKTTTAKKEAVPVTTPRPITLSAPGAIAITFDDGPGAHTGRLLDALHEYGIKVTFFVQGKFVDKYPDLILRMHQEGHQIGNHTYSHQFLTQVSSEVRSQQLMSTSDAIERITGFRPTLMRPPGGYGNEAVFQEAGRQGMASVFWDIDPFDWKTSNRSVGYVSNFLLNNAQQGRIILLHDIHQTTVDGFISALPALIEHGFTFVTVDELVKLEPGDVYPARWRR